MEKGKIKNIEEGWFKLVKMTRKKMTGFYKDVKKPSYKIIFFLMFVPFLVLEIHESIRELHRIKKSRS